MTLGRIGYEAAVLAVLCVLTIFFFPAMQGPYPAVHGPVTALRAVRLASRLKVAIVEAGLKLSRNCRLSAVALFSRIAGTDTGISFSICPVSHTILRC